MIYALVTDADTIHINIDISPDSYHSISLDAVKHTAQLNQVLKYLSHSCNDATDIGTNQSLSTCQSQSFSQGGKSRITYQPWTDTIYVTHLTSDISSEINVGMNSIIMQNLEHVYEL